jgi:cephalosporin hydroxylase
VNAKALINNIFFSLRERLHFAVPVINGNGTEFEVNNWIVSRFVLRKLVPIVGVLPFPLNEQMLMVAAVCRVQPTHIFEWGTNIGKSARIFFETCRTFNIDAQIHSIDLPDDVEHGEHPKDRRGMLVQGKKGVHLHLGDGLDTALRLLASIDRGSVRPLFFVDGDHGYASVTRELHGIIRNVPRASILLHDTFYQSAESGYNIGPWKAIEDVLKTTPHGFRILTQNMGLPGMTLLWNAEEKRPTWSS